MASETVVRQNIEIVRDYVEGVFNQHNPELAARYLAPGVNWHGGMLGNVEGIDGVIGMLRAFIGALPDLHAVEQNIMATEQTVAAWYVVEATYLGDLLSFPATGRRMRWDAIHVYRIVDGLIVEEWAADDMTAILHRSAH